MPHTHDLIGSSDAARLRLYRDVARLALGPAVALGLARFAYALLLPPMRADLGLGYAAAGWLNTANAFGYFLGALLTARLVARRGAAWSFRTGMWTSGALLVATGLTRDVGLLTLLRLAAGISGALVFIGGGVLAATLASRPGVHRGLALGLYYGGAGIGIVASGALLPPLLAFGAADGWQSAWVWLGVLAWLCAALARSAAAPANDVPLRPGAHPSAWPRAAYWPALLGYGLFGVGYIAYMTFVIAWLQHLEAGTATIAVFWCVLGLATIASSWVWAEVLERLRGGKALALLMAVLALASILPLIARGWPGLFASALLFGGSFLSVVSTTTALVRRTLPPAAWSAGIGAFTSVFALGQCIGPMATGWLADRLGGLDVAFAGPAAVLALGVAIALAQREVDFTSAAPAVAGRR